MGGSVFGMSTVPEVIAGYALGMEVFGISLCTNMACGILAEKLFHSDVTHVAKEAGPKFEALIVDMIYHLDMKSPAKAPKFLHSPTSHDVSTVGIMQRYPNWSGSEHVNPDAETLQRALFGDGCPELAIFANTGPVLQKLIVRMETMKSFSFSDLEQLCNLSPMAADKGNIFTGTFSDGFRVLVVEQTFKEGLFDFESHHIVGILCKIGVLSVIQIVESHIGRMETDAFIVDEIIDVTRDKLYPGSGFPRVNFKGSHIDEYCHGPLCVFPGPLMPSASERNLVEAVAAGAYTCTSLSTTYCAIQSGLKCDVIAVTKNDPNLELLPLINAIRAFHEQSSKRNSIWEGQVPAVKRYIFQQENLADVNFAASELKGALISDRGSTTIALVVDSALADTVADVKWFANVPVEAVQGWSQEFAQNWQLGFGEWANHKRVIFLYSSRRSPQNYAAPLSNATFAIRVLKKLGIEQVIFLGQARSCSDELPVDTIAIVADHVNFSGENPLCGTNVDEFGVQFPDLSDAYRKVGNHPCRAIVAYTPNLIATSAKLGESLGCSAFCETLIPEIIAARHASMAVTAIIWISSTFSDSNREQESVPHSVCQGIKTLIDEILAEDIGSNQPIDTRD
uniref:purine-nucleoside phosphorylase n=1 Tax=Spongospora subterranea TaxID=70186 RepID=A0A0H5QUL5_9EUKA|eukprot:CRZ05703.1 hypothetical protein [Spongospora subterranea]